MNRYLDGLRLQLLGFIILPLSLLLLALAFAGVEIHQDAMRRLVAERDERSVRAAAAAISEQLHHREAAARTLALQFSEGKPSEIDLEVIDYLLGDFDTGLVILNLDGEVIAGTDKTETGVGQLADEMLANMDDGETLFSEILLNDNSEGIILVIARQGDRFTIGAFTISSLMRTAAFGPLTGSENFSAFLTDNNGRVLTSVGADVYDDQLQSHPGVQAALRGETGSSYLPADDGEHVVAFSPILPTAWALIIEEPWESVASPTLNLSLITPLVLVPVLIVMLIALWFGSRQIVSPLRKLEQKADQLAEGEYGAVEEPVGGIAEIQYLQQTLILMSQRIQAAQSALRGYINTMTHTQEDERRRLARELHDETIQDLIALDQQIQMIGIKLRDDGLEDLTEVQELHTSTQDAIERVRRLSRGLRPIYLEDLGLIPALQMLAKDTEQELDIKISFRSEGNVRRFDAETELALYRIVQEALSNVGRHACAKHGWITIAFIEDAVTVTVRDDGTGFELPERISDLARYGHYGLIGMEERAVLINARLDIRSNPKQGSQITARLPIENTS